MKWVLRGCKADVRAATPLTGQERVDAMHAEAGVQVCRQAGRQADSPGCQTVSDQGTGI